MNDWYTISDTHATDSPALLLYPEYIQQNIEQLKNILPDTNRLRPHVKTHKSGDVSGMLINEGIRKFKCATIAEAEMLAAAGADDVLLAYQPVGPKAIRLRNLVAQFPDTHFSCLVDNNAVADHLSDVFADADKPLSVFLDLNIGMNRTGIPPDKAEALFDFCEALSGINVIGIHAYDGHIRDSDFAVRTQRINDGFVPVPLLAEKLEKKAKRKLTLVAGGSFSLPVHAKRKDVECSPGTFIYWDWSSIDTMKEQPYHFGALVLTRIVSKPTEDTLCLDLGHKSIASENPIGQRVMFLNGPDLVAVGHSEEHLIVRSTAGNSWKVGDVLYGVPFHICPTCALYDAATVVIDHKVTDKWNILSRKRMITV